MTPAFGQGRRISLAGLKRGRGAELQSERFRCCWLLQRILREGLGVDGL